MSKSKSKQVTKTTPSRKPTKPAKPTPATRSHRRDQQRATVPTIPAALLTPEFSAAWADWQRWHAEHGTALTMDDAARQLAMLARLGPDAAVADIRKTMREHVPAVATTPTPLVDVAQLEIDVPAAERGGEPATATPGDDAATVTTLTNDVMTNEVMTGTMMTSTIMTSTISPTADPASTSTEPEPVAVEVALPPGALAQPASAAAHEPTAAPAAPRASTTAPLPTGPLRALDAAAQVLAAAGKPLTCQQLIERMAAQGLWSSPKGKTPAGTLYSAILREQATKRDQARFVKTGRGQFAHRGAV